MQTLKEYSDELYKENKTLWEDKEYWKKLAEKRKIQLQQKENIIKEVREYIEQLLEYKKEDYYKGVSLDYVERILDILKGDLKYE